MLYSSQSRQPASPERRSVFFEKDNIKRIAIAFLVFSVFLASFTGTVAKYYRSVEGTHAAVSRTVYFSSPSMAAPETAYDDNGDAYLRPTVNHYELWTMVGDMIDDHETTTIEFDVYNSEFGNVSEGDIKYDIIVQFYNSITGEYTFDQIGSDTADLRDNVYVSNRAYVGASPEIVNGEGVNNSYLLAEIDSNGDGKADEVHNSHTLTITRDVGANSMVYINISAVASEPYSNTISARYEYTCLQAGLEGSLLTSIDDAAGQTALDFFVRVPADDVIRQKQYRLSWLDDRGIHLDSANELGVGTASAPVTLDTDYDVDGDGIGDGIAVCSAIVTLDASSVYNIMFIKEQTYLSFERIDFDEDGVFDNSFEVTGSGGEVHHLDYVWLSAIA